MPLAEFQHTTLQHQVGDMNIQQRACHLCAWVSEQETLQVKKLRRQLYNPMLQGTALLTTCTSSAAPVSR
jgi:hypothetical protein